VSENKKGERTGFRQRGGLSPGTEEEKKGKLVSPAKEGRRGHRGKERGKDRKERKERGREKNFDFDLSRFSVNEII
jgi:hypothetical protein